MVLDTTYYNKEHKPIIDQFVGESYSLWDAIRRGGVGSKRMIVEKLSPNLDHITNTTSDINYANIEIRKRGVLIHITKGLKTTLGQYHFTNLFFIKQTSLAYTHKENLFILKIPKCLKKIKRFLRI